MNLINCSIAHSKLMFHYVVANGDNLKVLLEELKLINSQHKLIFAVSLCDGSD